MPRVAPHALPKADRPPLTPSGVRFPASTSEAQALFNRGLDECLVCRLRRTFLALSPSPPQRSEAARRESPAPMEPEGWKRRTLSGGGAASSSGERSVAALRRRMSVEVTARRPLDDDDAPGAARVLAIADALWATMSDCMTHDDADAQITAYLNAHLVAPLNLWLADMRGANGRPLPPMPPLPTGAVVHHYERHFSAFDLPRATRTDAVLHAQRKRPLPLT